MVEDAANADLDDMHPTIPLVLGLPLILILAVASVPYGVCALIYQSAAEYRFRKLMTAAGRFQLWAFVLDKLTAGHGTLIVEQASRRGHRIWWTPDSVHSTSPLASVIPTDLDYLLIETPAPFVSWCFDQYCSPTTGRAFLTQCPISFPPGFIKYDWLKERFPKMDIVVTVMQK